MKRVSERERMRKAFYRAAMAYGFDRNHAGIMWRSANADYQFKHGFMAGVRYGRKTR